jgi:alpha-galactosidase/6-phospho-beta-glucosidase family protein
MCAVGYAGGRDGPRSRLERPFARGYHARVKPRKRGERRTIVIVGGGSNAWTPKIVRDMMLTPAIADSRFVLYDVRREAAELVAAFLKKLASRLGTGATIVATDDRRRAFDEAQYLVITISTGGLDAMARDLAIPEEYGIWHTVGDSVGPGGWARTIRNYVVFEDLARDINRWAPGAMVLNYTNPMASLTDALARSCSGPVVGLCHGLFENLEFLVAHYGLENESEVSVQYGGVNHFFWTTRITARGRDLLPDLRATVRRRGFTALRRACSADPAEARSYRELATALFGETGVMPYLGDRHTSEFFSEYLTDRTTLRRYRLERTSIADRRAMFRDRDRALRAMVKGEIPEEFLRRSRETAADIIAAHATGRPFIDVGNLPNAGQIANLPRGPVVETAVRVDGNGFSPICFGELPQPVLGLVEPHAHVQATLVRACRERNRDLAFAALRLDPLCAHLTGDRVREMGERLLRAHRRFTEGLFTPGNAG